jgi:hypothetical protein
MAYEGTKLHDFEPRGEVKDLEIIKTEVKVIMISSIIKILKLALYETKECK